MSETWSLQLPQTVGYCRCFLFMSSHSGPVSGPVTQQFTVWVQRRTGRALLALLVTRSFYNSARSLSTGHSRCGSFAVGFSDGSPRRRRKRKICASFNKICARKRKPCRSRNPKQRSDATWWPSLLGWRAITTSNKVRYERGSWPYYVLGASSYYSNKKLRT